MTEQAAKIVMDNWGAIGAFLIIFLVAIYVLWKSERKDRKKMSDEHAAERKADRDLHMEEFKKLFVEGTMDRKELIELIRTYSKDSKDFSLILKELELTIKHNR